MEIKKIVLTGPACTGKSTLAKELADFFDTPYVEEYAREYILSLNRIYTYEDVEMTAHRQLEMINEAEVLAIEAGKEYFFIDTGLLIILVWFEVVFNKVPDWIIEKLRKADNYIYLLCEPDLEWVPDPAREYGPEKQAKLFQRYEEILQAYNLKYFIINGKGIKRLESAVKAVKSL